MSNVLKPLVWARIDTEKTSGIYCGKTDSYIYDAVSFCSTPVADYVIRKDGKTGKYRANYGGRTENPYDTIDEAEHWAEFTHYASQMQPYVKPAPTWIDASERLPEEDGLYLAHYPNQPYEQKIVFFRSNLNKFNLFHELITHWMPIPDAPKESDCE